MKSAKERENRKRAESESGREVVLLHALFGGLDKLDQCRSEALGKNLKPLFIQSNQRDLLG